MNTRAELPVLWESRGYKVAAEVGVLRGEFSQAILAAWSGTLYMVDAWRQLPGYVDIANGTDDEHEANRQAAIRVAVRAGERAVVVRALSAEFARELDDECLDAVYIDADHSHAAVLADLAAWAPKVRRGGVISGHDYLDGVLPESVFGVRSAVLEFFGREPDVVTQEKWPSWLMEVK